MAINSDDVLSQVKDLVDKFGSNGSAPHTEDEAEDEKTPTVLDWKLESLADAYQANDPIEFLVDGLLPVPSLSIVYGGPGSLKSMLLCDLAVCVAGGKIWLEALPDSNGQGFSFPTKQCPVLWIDFDNGNRRTRERMAALGRGHEMPETIPFRYVSMPSPWLDASDVAVVMDLAELIKREASRLVIIDNLGLITGSTEENSGAMAQVMGRLRWLSEYANCAVIVVHHQRKSNGTLGTGVRKGETLRGHSSIEASLDLALLVERNGREDSVSVVATKVRDYQEFDTLGALWTFEHRPETKQLYAGRFFCKSVPTTDDMLNLSIKAHIKNFMRGGGAMDWHTIVDGVRDIMAAKPGGKAPGINKVRGLLKELVTDGDIQEFGTQQDRTYGLS